MKNITTKEFCTLFDACKEGHIFARNYADMRSCYSALLRGEAGAYSAGWAIWTATRKGVMPYRDLRLFAVRCARRVQHLMNDSRSVAALDVAERHALGQATNKELSDACDAANIAVYSSGVSSASATRAAARAAAQAAARNAAQAAVDAAKYAAWAAGAAAWAAAWDAEREEQLKLLAEFGNPFTEDAKT